MGIKQQLLKDCVEANKIRGHINSTTQTQLETYIDTLNDKDFLEIAYSSFDQSNSVNITFDDNARTATYSGAGTDELLTSTITLSSDINLKGIQIKGTDANETIQITKDGTTFFNVSAYNICEFLETTDTFKIKILVDGANTIYGLNLIYEKQI